MCINQIRKSSLVLMLVILGSAVCGQTSSDSVKLCTNIESLHNAMLNEIDFKCGSVENIDFLKYLKLEEQDELEEENPKLIFDDNSIIFRPYGEYVPGRHYTQTQITLLDEEELIFKVVITTVGSRYEYFECEETYYFISENNKWVLTSY